MLRTAGDAKWPAGSTLYSLALLRGLTARRCASPPAALLAWSQADCKPMAGSLDALRARACPCAQACMPPGVGAPLPRVWRRAAVAALAGVGLAPRERVRAAGCRCALLPPLSRHTHTHARACARTLTPFPLTCLLPHPLPAPTPCPGGAPQSSRSSPRGAQACCATCCAAPATTPSRGEGAQRGVGLGAWGARGEGREGGEGEARRARPRPEHLPDCPACRLLHPAHLFSPQPAPPPPSPQARLCPRRGRAGVAAARRLARVIWPRAGRLDAGLLHLCGGLACRTAGPAAGRARGPAGGDRRGQGGARQSMQRAPPAGETQPRAHPGAPPTRWAALECYTCKGTRQWARAAGAGCCGRTWRQRGAPWSKAHT